MRAVCSIALMTLAAVTAAAQPDADQIRRARAERRFGQREHAGQDVVLRPDLPGLFRRHVAYLADPAREGRAPGTQGIEDAADYIEDALLAIGLQPAFAGEQVEADGSIVLDPRSSFRQSLPVGERVETLDARVSFALPDGSILIPPEYEVSVYSGTGAFAGPCTFVGYAIVTGGGGYLGFTGVEDFRDRAVIMLSHEPMDELGRSLWSDYSWSFAAPLHRKVNAVVRRGAAAVFVVEPPDLNEELTGSPDPTGADRETMERFEIPVVWLPAAVIDPVLRAGDPQNRGLDALYRLANKQGVVVDLEGLTCAVQTSVQIRSIMSDNVGAILQGRGELAEQYVVIGAHYDHIGRGEKGAGSPELVGKIHPGADDNASGTAGLILVAEILTRRYDTLPADAEARSILFLALTGNETGLVGSRFYVDHPVAPIDDHVAMINLDMIGRLMFHGLEIGGVESAEQFDRIVEPHVVASGLDVRPLEMLGPERSDEASFLDRGIPSLRFFTGLHDEYHTPFDTADILDEQGGAATCELVAEIAFDLATRPDRPTWSGKTTRSPRDSTKEDGRVKVRTGIIPAARAPGEGMLITRVIEGSSADVAGLRAGDRITRWNGASVSTPEDWMPLLLQHEPGEHVKVEYLRRGERHSAELILDPIGDEE